MIACVAALTGLRACSADLLEEVASAAAETLHTCSTRQIAIMCRMLAEASVRSGEYFQAAAAVLASRSSGIAPQDMLNVLTAYQRLGVPLGPLLEPAQHFTQQHIASCSPDELTVFLSSLAEADCDVSSVKQAVVEALLEAIPDLSAQGVVDAAWALASLQLRDAALLDVLQTTACESVEQYTLRNLGTVSWAFAKLRHPCKGLLNKVIQRISLLLNQGAATTATDLALLLWSFAKLGHAPSRKVLSRMQTAIIESLPQASPFAVSMALAAFKALPYKPVQLVQALDGLSYDRLLEFEPRHISNMMHALASMRLPPGQPFLQNAIAVVHLQQDSFEPTEWANLTWSLTWFARHSCALGTSARNALEGLAPAILPSVQSCDGKECSRILWAYCNARVPARPLAAAYAAYLTWASVDLSPRSAATILWALGQLLGSQAPSPAVQHIVKVCPACMCPSM
eukprot:jgi/Ulvmu1/10489/UM064_0026.1